MKVHVQVVHYSGYSVSRVNVEQMPDMSREFNPANTGCTMRDRQRHRSWYASHVVKDTGRKFNKPQRGGKRGL